MRYANHRRRRIKWMVDVIDGDRILQRPLPIQWTDRGVTAEMDRSEFWIRYGPMGGVPYIDAGKPIPALALPPEPA